MEELKSQALHTNRILDSTTLANVVLHLNVLKFTSTDKQTSSSPVHWMLALSDHVMHAHATLNKHITM